MSLREPVMASAQPTARPSETPSVQISVWDRIERLIIVTFYVQLVVRMVRDAYLLNNAMALILLPSEGLVITLVLLRKPASELTTSWSDWFFALTATALPMMVIATPRSDNALMTFAAAWLALVGLILQILAKLALGRSMGMVAANRGIRVSGPYRFIRHPMYIGYLLSHLAFLSMNWCAWNVVLLTGVFVMQLQRVVAEETILQRDPTYRLYQQQVKHRFIPGVY